MSQSSGEGTADEARRIQDVYAERKRSIPANRYSLLRTANLLRIQQIERALARELALAGYTPLADSRVLDVGCGDGFWLRELVKLGAHPHNLHGVDLLSHRIEQARVKSPSGMTLTTGSAASLEYPASSFDIVTQFVMFSSIVDWATRQRVAAEMRRVVKPGGRVIWFDFHFDNPRNPNVRGIRRRELSRLFQDVTLRYSRICLVPPVANLVAGLPLLYETLCEVPWLCSHHLAAMTMNAVAEAVGGERST